MLPDNYLPIFDCPNHESAGCKPTERFLDDGTCEACPKYTRAQGVNKDTCGSDKCEFYEKLLEDGACETCPDNMKVTADQKGCVTPVCPGADLVPPEIP